MVFESNSEKDTFDLGRQIGEKAVPGDVYTLVGDLGVMAIRMQSDDEVLDEIVIIGAGTQKKVSVTGSISTIEGSTLKSPSSSLTQSIWSALPPWLSGKSTFITVWPKSRSSGSESGVLARSTADVSSAATESFVLVLSVSAVSLSPQASIAASSANTSVNAVIFFVVNVSHLL